MKHINENVDITPIKDYINFNLNEQDFIDEGLGDAFAKAKKLFKSAIKYMKSVIAKVGKMFVAVDDSGNVVPAVLPVAAGVAYNEGIADPATTYVVLNAEDKKVVPMNTSFAKVVSSMSCYDKYKDMVAYWNAEAKNIDESLYTNEDMINEVKMENEDPESKYATCTSPDELYEEIMAQVEDNTLAPLIILGAPGIGKTAIVQAVADTMRKNNPNYRVIFKSLSNETADNFTLPVSVYGKDGKTVEKVTDVPKDWLPLYLPSDDAEENKRRDEACGEGLLFIDELSRAKESVRNIFLPLFNEHKFNDYKLGSGWAIVAASNREEDETEGQTAFGNALINRFGKIWYEPTYKSWREWAEKQNYISPIILQWLDMPASEEFGGSKFYYYDPNEEYDDGSKTQLMCTPRAWTRACQDLANFAHTADLSGHKLLDIDKRILIRGLRKHIPASVIDKFLSFVSVIDSVGDLDDIVDTAWNGGRIRPLGDALRKITLPIAQIVVGAHRTKLPTTEEFDHFADWLVEQDSDQLASYCLDICKTMWLSDLEGKGDAQDLFFSWSRYKELIRKKADAKTADKEIEYGEKLFKKVLAKFDMTLDDMPDWYPGMKKLGTKYREAFKSAVVNGKEALG